jgi:photosystem II stability/assembly factor-like uncharacterized protein
VGPRVRVAPHGTAAIAPPPETKQDPVGAGAKGPRREGVITVLESLKWRLVGPHRGGRVVAVAGHPTDRQVFYFGACAGGVWRTDDGGWTWRNISDGFFTSASVGALAVADADPNVIYAGTGECSIRSNVVAGDGVYRSTDGGRTWQHAGLRETRHIGRVRVHPRDPDTVYVAALGHAYGPNPERGVYRSRDGGRHWELVLHRSDRAGCVDLSMDPTNPRILYAGFWEVRRYPWGLESGGPGSGLFKSSDGGDTWVELSGRPGLPKGLTGKHGVAVSPARPDRVWALIEAEDGGLFRSDDGGETWIRVNEQRELRQRAFYYTHLYADPRDPEVCYVLNFHFWRSDDGGRTFAAIPTPHVDNHDLWLDPRDPRRMIEGNDGGACVSFTGGTSWSTLYNQPTAQFYHVTTDTRFPYRLYGSQQDNTTCCIPSRSARGAITLADWYPVGGGENGYIAVRPDDPDIVYAGDHTSLTRYDHRTGQSQQITVWPERPSGWGSGDLKYRLQWTYPVHLSPHDPGVLYVGAQYVLRSTDEGRSWERISPDLTRAEPSTMLASGGPITKDNSGAEYYATIFAFAESPRQRGVLWAGSDDGLIHVSRDGGASWRNVTPDRALLPEWSRISIIEASPHDPATAYVAANHYQQDDDRPLLLKTHDYGASWRPIVNGIRAGDFTRCIREDPVRRGLLYCGTEHGVYVSFDDGESWDAALQRNLPVVPVHDLVVHGTDLVAATHGRSFWILDDITPLRQMSDEIRRAAVHLFEPRTAYRLRGGGGWAQAGRAEGRDYLSVAGLVVTQAQQGGETAYLDAGANPPNGAIIHYYLRQAPAGELTLAFYDAAGNLVRQFSSGPAGGEAGGGAGTGGGTGAGTGGDVYQREAGGGREPRVPAAAGMNRFVWDLRYPGATAAEGTPPSPGGAGPVVVPGTYRVRLTVDGTSQDRTFEVRLDPRVRASQADLEAQLRLLLQVRDKLSETNAAIGRIRQLRAQVEAWVARASGRPSAEKVAAAGRSLAARLTAVEEQLIQTRSRSNQDSLNFPVMLNAKLLGLAMSVGAADAAPTRQQGEVYADLAGRVDAQLRALAAVLETEVPMFDAAVREAGIPPVAAG